MKKKRSINIIVVLLAVFFISTLSAHATLELRGTDSQGNQLIYDTDLNITWYDYSPWDDWQSQMDWASALSVSGGDLVGVYDDWRLPTDMNPDGSGPCWGYRCTGTEMGHLFYTELGNIGYIAPDGTLPQPGWGLNNTGDFQDLQDWFYWTGTEDVPITNDAFDFSTYYGNVGVIGKTAHRYAMAVRVGDVIVPEPISSILFVTGGTLLAGRCFIKRKKKA